MNTQTKKSPALDHFVTLYGDLLFDLCSSVLWSPVTGQNTVRKILKTLEKTSKKSSYQRYERAWVLRVACDQLLAVAKRNGRRLTPSEQVMLDANLNTTARLRQFDSYFHKLSTDDQILLLLKDKYGLPYFEISAALNTPEDSLKIKRQQALRALEEWLWSQ